MRSFVLSSLVLLCLSSAATAVSFKNTASGVWSTGLDNAAVVLAGNTVDSHYFLIKPAGCDAVPAPSNCTGFGPNAVTVIGPPDGANPIWTANDANSAWVGPIGDQRNVQANTIFNSSSDFFVYRLFVNFGALGLYGNTATVQLRWLSDNNINNVNVPTEQSHIRVCAAANPTSPVCGAGTRVASSNSGAHNVNPFNSQPAVTLGPSVFTAQQMAIDFVVFNSPVVAGANPTGLRVEILSANADPVPEPMTLSMIALGLIGLGLYRRSR
ncbi:MAG: PEP-CTERM sorting domain-containing protein [Bryobacterales bacterium]|nr:PEP-CTERM sorting domain-containing protein [Bryobacterales bacterium]